jgi:hypothetical protein
MSKGKLVSWNRCLNPTREELPTSSLTLVHSTLLDGIIETFSVILPGNVAKLRVLLIPCYSVFSLFLKVKLDNSHTRESSKNSMCISSCLIDHAWRCCIDPPAPGFQLMICCTMRVWDYTWAALFTAYTVVLLCSSTSDHELDLDLGCQVAILSRGCWPESIPWLFAKWKLSRLRAQWSPRSRTFGVWCGDAAPNGDD